MAYQRIDWKNEPIEETPLSAENLNHMEDGIVANEKAIEEVSEIVEGKQDTLTFDDVPTKNSNNPVKSNGIYDAILNVLLTDSESGNPCVITDAFNTNAKSVKLTLNPIQSGSGTPSPQNVRPISGRTEANVTRTGKNLCGGEWQSGAISSTDGVTIVASAYWCYLVDYRPVVPDTTLCFSAIRNTALSIYWYDANKAFIRYDQPIRYTNPNTIVVPANAYYCRYGFNVDGASVVIQPSDVPTYKLQVEVGSTATTYEAYNGATYTIDLDGTRYGGTVDFKTGVLTVEWTLITPTVTSVAYSQSVQNNYALCNVSGLQLDAEAISNMYAYTKTSVTASEGTFRAFTGTFAIYDNDFTTKETAQAKLNDCRICYKLATPTSIPLTAQNITLLHGDNVLTTDADSIKASYSADIALYIDKKIAEGISQGNRSLSKGGSSEWAEEPKEEIKEESEETPEINEK